MEYTNGQAGKGEIAARFVTDDATRTESLERARLCAALTKPPYLPPKSRVSGTKFPEAYQSIGSWGVTNFVGAMHAATFPAGLPWFSFSLPPEIENNPNIPDRRKQDMLNDLFAFQVTLQALIDSSHLDDSENGNVRPAAFFSRQYSSMTSLAITGDTLDFITDQYRIKRFRRDKYVTKRDDCGDILYHVTSESVDPLGSLTPLQREKAKIKDTDLKEYVCDRMMPMHTMVEWQPITHTFVIRQEVNGWVVNTSQEPVSPYLSVPYELCDGDDYGVGFVEQNLGDLRSVNNLEKRMLEFAAMCSKFHFLPDQNCQVDRNDLKGDSGTVIEGTRMVGGVCQDLGVLKIDKASDFSVVDKTITRKYASLARNMLIESEITPQRERTTAFQVSRVVAQLQSATGGMSSTIQDEKHIPLIRRLTYMARRDNILEKWPDKSVHVQTLTGLAAIAKQSRLGNLLGAMDVLGRISPNIVQRIDEQTMIDTVFRYSGVHEPGFIKDDAQMEKERQAAIAAHIQTEAGVAAGQQAAEVGGQVAQATLLGTATGQRQVA